MDKPLAEPRQVGRYLVFGALAAGGMATVHLGRLVGPVGFSRTVAVKRLHAQFACDPEFVAMFLDEARVAARIRHPNVVSVLDVVAEEGELVLVMEFVMGESLSRLVRPTRTSEPQPGRAIAPRIAAAILVGALQGLHAAHETRGEDGEPLHIVHRDVSPQNILLGQDGVARIIDFGVAKAVGRLHATEAGQVKGKLAYMAPEQMRGQAGRGADIFGAGVVMWELLTGRRLFVGETDLETYTNVLRGDVPAVSELCAPEYADAARALEPVLTKALAREADDRYVTAREFALAIEQALQPASTLEVSSWLELTAGDELTARGRRVAQVEEFGSTSNSHETLALFAQNLLDGVGRTPAPPTVAGTARPGRADSSARSAGAAPSEPTLQESEYSLLGTSDIEVVVQPARRQRWLGPALALGVLVVLCGLGFAWSRTDSGSRQHAVTPVVRGADSGPRPAEPAPTASLAPRTNASAEHAATHAPTPATSVAEAEAAAATESSAPTPTKANAAAKPVKPRAASCSPPYTVDANGHKRFKPECF